MGGVGRRVYHCDYSQQLPMIPTCTAFVMDLYSTVLCVCSCRVLRKEPASAEIGPQDVFKFNEAYTSRLFRVKINNLQMQ